jgi:hypothetical protein
MQSAPSSMSRLNGLSSWLAFFHSPLGQELKPSVLNFKYSGEEIHDSNPLL